MNAVVLPEMDAKYLTQALSASDTVSLGNISASSMGGDAPYAELSRAYLKLGTDAVQRMPESPENSTLIASAMREMTAPDLAFPNIEIEQATAQPATSAATRETTPRGR